MRVLMGNKFIFFDVDDTLVMWSVTQQDKADGVAIPVTLPGANYINASGDKDYFPGFTEYLRPNKKHIACLKRHKANGDTIVVWSAGGYDWAEAVVKALVLEKDVDLIMSKPSAYYDDLDCPDWMGTRIYYREKGDE